MCKVLGAHWWCFRKRAQGCRKDWKSGGGHNMFPLHCMFKLTLRKHLTDCLPNRQPNHYHAKDGTSKLPIFDRNYFKHDLSTVFSTDICRVKNIPKKSKYTIYKWLCQRYWLIGVYGTSKLPKMGKKIFSLNGAHTVFLHNLIWYQMSISSINLIQFM